MKFNLWVEGYSATGESGKAQFLGTVVADTFIDACRSFAARAEHLGPYTEYENEGPAFWRCKLYDNEASARRSFG